MVVEHFVLKQHINYHSLIWWADENLKEIPQAAIVLINLNNLKIILDLILRNSINYSKFWFTWPTLTDQYLSPVIKSNEYNMKIIILWTKLI